ncbi:erythrocyte membrane protein 1, EMP1, partial [Plasmodium reichenowi]
YTYFFVQKKTKSSVDMLRVLQIPKGDYDMPTLKSSNRYIPYASGKYRGKRYIYLEGDTDEEKYMFMSDTTDITSSESEYEEMDINDIYVPGSPKYKTLIEVVLEPSKRDTQNDIPSDTTNTPSDNTPPTSDIPSTITDEEWNQMKDDFISNILQNEQNDIPNNNISATIPTNTNNTTPSHNNVDNDTHPTMSRDNVDNNTHPTPSHNKLDQKPFIMSIHDRNLLNGEEYNYDMSNNIGNNDLYSGSGLIGDNRDSYSGKKNPITDNRDSYSGKKNPITDNRDSYSGTNSPISDKNGPYSGIDLINNSLSGDHDIYNEILKRKENELFGTNHVKHTSTHGVAKHTNFDPIHNQLDLFHKWLDKHRNMCDQWDTNNKKEELLDKLKEEWENETHSGNKHSDIPSNNIHSDNIPSHTTPSSNKMLNSDVSIQIHMDKPKQVDDNTYLDTYPDKYTVDNINPVDSNNSTYNHRNPADINKTFVDKNNQNQHPIEKPTKIQIEINSNNREVVEQQYPIADMWNI